MQDLSFHKSVIRDFYRRALGQGDTTFVEQFVADDYVNHGPAAITGKAEVLAAVRYMGQLPKPANPPKPFLRLIAEDDYVVTNLAFEWAGTPKVVVDLFRFHDGKLVEHWDAVEDQPATTPSGRPVMDGPQAPEDLHLTAANKTVAEAFYRRVLLGGEWAALPEFVSPDLMQHNPRIADGIGGIREYLHRQAGVFASTRILRVVAEGNFVVFQTEGGPGEKQAMHYDVFRLSGGKIVEQWGVG
jgi:predicted SnoaL-like aldol condensation-catalyzing enzyme